eukprot:2713856-Ditylum_brightwellii.AAC.1
MAEGNEVMGSHQEVRKTAWAMSIIKTRRVLLRFEMDVCATGFLHHHLQQLKLKELMEWLR